MTIIFNLSVLAAAFLCFFVGSHFRKSYARSRIEELKDCSNAFFGIGLAYIFLAFPRLILFNPFWVQIDFILSDLFFLAALLFFTSVIFSFSEKLSRFKKNSRLFISYYLLGYIFFTIIFFSPAIPLKINDIIYYWKSGIPWLQNITRALFCLAALAFAIFLIYHAKTIKTRRLFWRSFLSGFNFLIATMAGFLFWFSPLFCPSPKLLVFSGLLGLFGFTIGIAAVIIFQPPRETFVKKIT